MEGLGYAETIVIATALRMQNMMYIQQRKLLCRDPKKVCSFFVSSYFLAPRATAGRKTNRGALAWTLLVGPYGPCNNVR